ncbi:MAG: hypothetical protein KJ950_04055 [Proteobacteria bacterium]|nr:hypothetical protein [Pseudomonadota bacterium]MBU1688380.1 hypothetical protein [Pseudomonadota bacterium]
MKLLDVFFGGQGRWMVSGALLLVLAGCGLGRHGVAGVSEVVPDFFGISNEIARQLVTDLRKDLPGDRRIVLTTLVSVDDLYRTSGFGRAMSESLATGMFRRGFGLVEVRKMAGLTIQQRGGELVLSREAALVSQQTEVAAIVAGTYSVTPETVIINVRLLEAGSNDVLSVAGLELERSRLINSLLKGVDGDFLADGRLSAYER